MQSAANGTASGWVTEVGLSGVGMQVVVQRGVDDETSAIFPPALRSQSTASTAETIHRVCCASATCSACRCMYIIWVHCQEPLLQMIVLMCVLLAHVGLLNAFAQ